MRIVFHRHWSRRIPPSPSAQGLGGRGALQRLHGRGVEHARSFLRWIMDVGVADGKGDVQESDGSISHAAVAVAGEELPACWRMRESR